MKKSKNLFLFTIILFLFGCKGEAQKNDLNKIKKTLQQNITLDDVLKDGDYTWDEDFFMTADYGVIYNQKTNPFGNLKIYLIPKNKLKIKDEQIEEENNRVNELSIHEYKEKFKIIIFLINKKDLNNAESGDPAYYQKPAYEEKIYTYDEKANQWIFLDSIKILNESENEKEQIWREKYIYEQIQSDTNSQNKVPLDYKLIQEQQGDINLDGKTDKIAVYGTEWKTPTDLSDALSYIVRVFLSNEKGNFTILDNKNIIAPYYRENVADGFSDVKIKNNFFTIEQVNAGGNYTVIEYTTFKYDSQKRDIFLHKYSTISTERNSGDEKEETSNYSEKDFGFIKFSNFASSSIIDKIKTKK